MQKANALPATLERQFDQITRTIERIGTDDWLTTAIPAAKALARLIDQRARLIINLAVRQPHRFAVGSDVEQRPRLGRPEGHEPFQRSGKQFRDIVVSAGNQKLA